MRAQIYISPLSIMIFLETFVHFLLFLHQWLRKVDLLFHGLYRYLGLAIHAVLKHMLPLFWGPGPLIPRLTLGPRLDGGQREPREAFNLFYLRLSWLFGKKCVNYLILYEDQLLEFVSYFMLSKVYHILIFHRIL